ncbi:MAG: hypothetical protein GVY13_18890 [Alphaproteobacteria bacterium]|jgi:hypothetical protein|nr:hypothetical protein [Alphaproteobacteria bacterium]
MPADEQILHEKGERFIGLLNSWMAQIGAYFGAVTLAVLGFEQVPIFFTTLKT